ncbi:hypothetical protein ACH5RR_032896 [Cinchona calisaya]|uniref:Uncharacterized protein n=1 Tax=Cinchona calisaya TaxID=153742 RepID=A0ABD2YLU6_9GENT
MTIPPNLVAVPSHTLALLKQILFRSQRLLEFQQQPGRAYLIAAATTLIRYHGNRCGIDTLKLRLSEFAAVAPDHVNTWLQIAVENGVKSLKIGTNDSFLLPKIIFEAKIACEIMVWQIPVEAPSDPDNKKIEDCVGLVNIKVTKLQKLEELSIGFQESGRVEVETPSLEEFLYANCTLSSSYSDDEEEDP